MKKYYYTKEFNEKLKSLEKLPKWLKHFPGYKEQMKLIREVLGFTQVQLGKRLKLSGRNIRRIENGEQLPNVSMLERIAEILNAELKISFVPKNKH